MIPSEQHKEGRDTQIGDRLANTVVTYLVSLLLALPLFIILNAYVPELRLPFGDRPRIDHAITFIAVLMAFIVLVKRFQLAVYAVLIIGMLSMTVTSLTGMYTFGDLYNEYAGWLRNLRDSSAQVPMAAQRNAPFYNAEKLRALVDDDDPAIRRQAVRMATMHFTKVAAQTNEQTLVQSFSIFKEVNARWTYVSDPSRGEYFAPPTESIELMAGDCDDHAVLMAALINAIGGQVRLVRTTGHVYPELLVGDDLQLERAAYLIRKVLFPHEVGDAPLYHHTDADGRHWINLDYTRRYPGGELMNEQIIGILDA